MSRAKIEIIDEWHIQTYAHFGSEREDEEAFYKQAKEKEEEEVRDFVRCHPMPSPDDEEGDKCWNKVIDRLKTQKE